MLEAIRFECLKCGKWMRATPLLFGKKISCPECSQVLSVPLPVYATENGQAASTGSAGRDTPEENSLKRCPFCAERIQATAIKCRYCNEMIGTADHPAKTPPTPKQPKIVKEIRASIPRTFSRIWGHLCLYEDRITFKGETQGTGDIVIPIRMISDVNDRRDGGQQHLVINYRDSRGELRSVFYDYPSTFGERISTPNDRRTSWGDWVRVISDLMREQR